MGIRFVVVDGWYEVTPPTIFMLGRLMRSSSLSSLSTLLASFQDPDMLDVLDVLDADLSGELEVHEVASCLMKLHGPVEKTDVVVALLGVRVTTSMIQSIFERNYGDENGANFNNGEINYNEHEMEFPEGGMPARHCVRKI